MGFCCRFLLFSRSNGVLVSGRGVYGPNPFRRGFPDFSHESMAPQNAKLHCQNVYMVRAEMGSTPIRPKMWTNGRVVLSTPLKLDDGAWFSLWLLMKTTRYIGSHWQMVQSQTQHKILCSWRRRLQFKAEKWFNLFPFNQSYHHASRPSFIQHRELGFISSSFIHLKIQRSKPI